MPDISNVINVALQPSPALIARADMNLTVIITGDQTGPLSSSERFRLYRTDAAVADDWGTTSPVYAHAQAFMSTAPNPVGAGSVLAIGYWRKTDEPVAATSATLSGVPVPESATIAALQGISNGALTIAIDGGTVNASGMDFRTTTTLSGAASIISAALAGATVAYVNNAFVVTADSTGALSTLGYATTPPSGTDLGVLLSLTSAEGATVVAGADATTITSESKIDALTALKSAVDFKGAHFVDDTDPDVAPGTIWSPVGTPYSIAGATAVYIERMQDNAFAAYDTTNGQLRYLTFDGSAFVQVGASLPIASTSVSFAALNATDLALYDASADLLSTYRWGGASWSLVGTPLSVINLTNTAMAAMSGTDIALAGETANSMTTYRWNGSTWAKVGNSLTISTAVSLTALTSNSVAVASSAIGGIIVYAFDGTNWGVSIAATAIAGLLSPEIYAWSATRLALYDSAIDELRVYQLSGSTWIQVGTPLSIPLTSTTNMAVASFNSIALASDAIDTIAMYALDTVGDATGREDLASWAQANSTLVYDVFHDADNLAIDVTNPVWAAKLAGHTNYRMLYSKSGNRRLGASYMARMHTVNFGGDSTATTMEAKSLAVLPENYSDAEVISAAAVGLDLYTTVGGVPWTLTSGANVFTDERYNLLALVNAVQVDAANVIKGTNTQIGQTAEGVAALVDQARRTLQQFVRAGVLAPGAWTSPDTFGDRETFLRNISEFGYYVLAGSLADQPQQDREDRKSPVIQIAIKGAGAIHKANYIINFNR